MYLLQKIGFGVFGVMLTAYVLQAYLFELVIVSFVIAMLTLAWVRWILFTGTQAVGGIISGTAHTVGDFGDTMALGSRNIKAHLRQRPAVTESLEMMPHEVDLSDFTSDVRSEPSYQLDVPDFIKGAMDRQNN